jgi:hypothetical protein
MKLAGALALILVLASASLARADMLGFPMLGPEDAPSGFFGGASAFAGSSTNSYTRVREHSLRGTYLYMGDDLGIPVIGELRLDGGWRFDPEDSLALSFGYIWAWGSNTLHADTDYNGGTFQGGTKLSSQPLWFVVEFQYERALFRFMEGDRGMLGLDIGFRYDWLHWEFSKSTFTQTSAGHEAGEKFLSQATPIPVLGLTARFPVAENVDLVASARGMRLNHISSGRIEGGIIYFSQSLIDATLGLVIHTDPNLSFSFGFRYVYVDITEESKEDGNNVGLYSAGAYFSIAYTF